MASGQDRARYSWNNQIMATGVCTPLVGTCKSHQEPARKPRVLVQPPRGVEAHCPSHPTKDLPQGLSTSAPHFWSWKSWQKIHLEALQSNAILCWVVQHFTLQPSRTHRATSMWPQVAWLLLGYSRFLTRLKYIFFLTLRAPKQELC